MKSKKIRIEGKAARGKTSIDACMQPDGPVTPFQEAGANHKQQDLLR